MELNIHLNDFDSFGHFLFGDEERDWKTFLTNEGYFIPPIANPIDIVQNQLCHYAYWMTISKNDLARKPYITTITPIPSLCFACHYASLVTPYPIINICHFCPLEKNTEHSICGEEHYIWKCSNPYDSSRSYLAERIAKMIWKNPLT